MNMDLMKDMAKLRRDMPRNEVVMRVLDALDVALKEATRKTELAIDPPVQSSNTYEDHKAREAAALECPVCAERRKKDAERAKRARERRGK